MWIAALVVAAVLFTLSTMKLAQANPRSPLPWMGTAESEPRITVVLRLLGVFVGLVGGLLLTPPEHRVTFGIGVLLILLPTVVVTARHNARVKTPPRH